METIDRSLSFTWSSGFAWPVASSEEESGLRKTGQFIRWSGFLLSPRSDSFMFRVLAAKMATSLYIDNQLVFDSDAGISDEVTVSRMSYATSQRCTEN